MGVAVIVCYRPRPGMEDELLAAVRDHLPVLRGEDLVTDRPATELPAVQALWARFEQACEYVRLADLPEAEDLFASFEPIEL